MTRMWPHTPARSHVSIVLALLVSLVFGSVLVLRSAPPARADGTETLGPPSVAIAEGTGLTIAGTGLFVQPSSFDVVIPDDAAVEQVLLYWEAGHRAGDTSGESSDETIRVNGIEVFGPHVGGPTVFFTDSDGRDVITSTHRSDITDLGLVGPGTTTLTIDGLDTDEIDDGAGVVVIYSQTDAMGQPIVNELGLRDGNDIAFVRFPSPRDTTVPQTFTFSPSSGPRTAELGLMATSTHRSGDIGPPRPSALVYTVGGVTRRIDEPFPDIEGDEYDSIILDVEIPPGATELTAQLLSVEDGENVPASLVWLVASLVVPSQVGELEVRKVVVDPIDPDQQFDIDVSCSNGLQQPLTLAGGESEIVGGLPLGTTCTVAEPDVPEGWAAPVIEPEGPVTIGAEVQVVTVTNSSGGLSVRKQVSELGNLEVTKTLRQQPDPESGYVPGSTFGFRVQCQDGRDEPFRLADGQTQLVAGIPVGTTCTVTETDAPPLVPPFEWEPVPVRTVTIQGGAPGQEFDIDVSCSNGQQGVLLLADGGVGTVGGVPPGTICTITEQGPPAGWQTPVFEPSGTVTVGEVDEVVVTNIRTTTIGLQVINFTG